MSRVGTDRRSRHRCLALNHDARTGSEHKINYAVHGPERQKNALGEDGAVWYHRAMEWLENTTEGLTVISLKGEIDLQFSPALRGLLQTQSKKHLPILLLDFSEVGYIDSSGLATLVEYYQQARSYGGRIALAALNPRVRSIFDLVRLNEIFPIFDTVVSARAELSPTRTDGLGPG